MTLAQQTQLDKRLAQTEGHLLSCEDTAETILEQMRIAQSPFAPKIEEINAQIRELQSQLDELHEKSGEVLVETRVQLERNSSQRRQLELWQQAGRDLVYMRERGLACFTLTEGAYLFTPAEQDPDPLDRIRGPLPHPAVMIEREGRLRAVWTASVTLPSAQPARPLILQSVDRDAAAALADLLDKTETAMLAWHDRIMGGE